MSREYEKSISQYFEEARLQCVAKINGMPHEKVSSIDAKQWEDELMERYELPLIEQAGEPTSETQTVNSSISDYGDMVPVEFEYLIVDIPIIHKPKVDLVLSLQPAYHEPMLPEDYYSESHFGFRIRIGTVSELDKPHVQENLRKKLEQAIEGFRKEFESRNQAIERELKTLRHVIEEAILKRKEQVGKKEAALAELAGKISIPLRKKTEAPPKVIVLRPSEGKSGKVPLRATPSAEYLSLERAGFDTLLRYIERYLRDCERTPQTFQKLHEEEIRNLLLPYLNQVFEGGATGETFSKSGKTDIYLVIQKGCILICECKWWRGPASVEEVTQQVFDRVTWRENFGIVLIFVKEDFLGVVSKVEQTIANLSHNPSGQVRKINAGHLAAILALPKDARVTVEVHYILCNFAG